MITKEIAMSLQYGQTLHYTGKHECTRHIGPRGGVKEEITAVRVSGQCKTWKTRPNEFRVPVKYGMYENSAVENWNASNWHLASDCPLLAQKSSEQG